MSSSTGKGGVIVAPDESTNMDKLVSPSHAVVWSSTSSHWEIRPVSCISLPAILGTIMP